MNTKTNKTWQWIGPNELLPIGTPVEVKNKQGRVIKAEMVPASNNPSSLVCLHTTHFTTRKGVTNLWTRIKRMKAKDESVNYSFILAYK